MTAALRHLETRAVHPAPRFAIAKTLAAVSHLARRIIPRIALLVGAVLRAEYVDPNFNPDANANVQAIAVQPDGKILVGGLFTRIAGSARSYFVRLNEDGSPDTSFNPGVAAGTVSVIALQPDGRILVGGSITSVAGQSRGRLVRFHATGALDAGFNPNVSGTVVHSLVVQPDGKIVIGGNLTAVGGNPRTGLARLNTDGTLDTEFAADASGTVGSAAPGVFTLAREADGSILAGGQFTSVAGQTRWGLARVGPTGVLDPAFSPFASFSPVLGIAVQPDGKILLGGGTFTISQTRRYLARLFPNGTFDTPFNPALNSPAYEIVPQAGGKILFGGLFTSLNDAPSSFLARVNADGSTDASLGVEVSGALGTSQSRINAVVATTDGRIYVGGTFSIVGGQTRNGIARLLPNAPLILSPPRDTSASVGGTVTFSVVASGIAPTYQWRKDGVAIPGATAPTLTLTALRPGDFGDYDVVVTNGYGTVTCAPARLALNTPPVITVQPTSLAVTIGLPAVFTVSAVGTPAPTHQWQRNGAIIAGATSSTYSIAATQMSDAASYSCVITNGVGTTISDAVMLAVLAPGRLSNVSVRTTLGAGEPLIVGFVVSNGATNVLARAGGPALAAFGITSAMADPRLELYKDSTKIFENNDWPAVLAPAMNAVGAFPFLPNSRDAALMQSSSGGYSAVATGTGPGMVLVEIYDAEMQGTGQLINISARNRVGAEPDQLIAGFNIVGAGMRRVLIRAVGPTIGGVPFNVPGTLADPKLELYDSAGKKMTENDTWDPALATVFTTAGAFALAPASKDAALVVTLPAGSYTAQVTGAGNTTGIALIEIYELP